MKTPPYPILLHRKFVHGGGPGYTGPLPLIDPALRIFTDTGGTTPATADGDIIRCIKTSASESLTNSGTNSVYGTQAGKRLITNTNGFGSNWLNGTVTMPIRPSYFDFLFAFCPGTWAPSGAFTNNILLATIGPSAFTAIQFNFGRQSGTDFAWLYVGALRLWSASFGLATSTAILTSGTPLIGGAGSAWHWARLSVVPNLATLRLYSGPGVELGSATRVPGAPDDWVMETGNSGTCTLRHPGRNGGGQLYVKTSSSELFTNDELAEIFAYAAYP